MRISDRAVVLRVVKHGDSKRIIRLFSLRYGTLNVMTRVSKNPSSRVRTAVIMPLHFIEAVIILRSNRDIHQLTEAVCYRSGPEIYSSSSRLQVAQFINEVLLKALTEQPANPELFRFIESSLAGLADPDCNLRDVHLHFMKGLAEGLGFAPQNNFDADNRFFDCREGRFSTESFPFPLGLNEKESELMAQFLSTPAGGGQFSKEQRKELLQALLAYFAMHVPAFQGLRSPDVLQEISI
jgi:DNA repair protein RecO (recombination protein O)